VVVQAPERSMELQGWELESQLNADGEKYPPSGPHENLVRTPSKKCIELHGRKEKTLSCGQNLEKEGTADRKPLYAKEDVGWEAA